MFVFQKPNLITKVSFFSTKSTICCFSVVFQELGAPLTFDEVEEIIRKADVDNDGKLGFEDFEKVMKGLTVNTTKQTNGTS